jgi:hypothetical protein
MSETDDLRSRLNKIAAPCEVHTDSSGVSTSITSTPTTPRSDAEQAEAEGAVRRRKQDLGLLWLSVKGEGLTPIEPPPPVSREKSKRELRAEQKAEERAFILRLEDSSEYDYCKAMHDAGRQTPQRWQKWGCPPDYLVAFNLKPGRLRDHFLKSLRHSERKNARRHAHLSAKK